MNPKEPIRAMVDRIAFNSQYISAAANTAMTTAKTCTSLEGPYEVTQSLATLMLMLALTESARKQSSTTSEMLVDVQQNHDWPVLETVERPVDKDFGENWDSIKPDEWLGHLTLLRNSLAHGNIVLEGDPGREIMSVQVFNNLPRDKNKPSEKTKETWRRRILAIDLPRMIDVLKKKLPT